MLTIRFLRTSKKNQPFFRIVVTDKNNPPRGGNFLEILGFYNPLTKEKNLKAERIKYWIGVGAQPSDSIHNLLVSEKIIEGKKVDVHKKAKKTEENKEEVKENQGETKEEAPADEPKDAPEKKEEASKEEN